MRGSATPIVVSLATVLALLAGSVASAQDEPEPLGTAPPLQFDEVSMALVQNELTEPAIRGVVANTATFAFTEIGGVSEGKKNGLDILVVPGRDDVVSTARDAAEAGKDVVVVSGGDSQGTVGFAPAYPSTYFVEIDQPLPCVTSDGRADPSGTCEGGAVGIPLNHMTVGFDTDQAAYLAGVVAAAASRDDMIGVISGTAECPDCNRTLTGFVRGAQSIKPEIQIQLAYLADEGEEAAFGDPSSARTFAEAFIDVYEPDVILPLAGLASRGVIEAACEAGILAVGVDIDVAARYPELAECVLTSITKDYEYAVRESLFAIANGEMAPEWRLGLAGGHVGITDEWTRRAGLPVDLAERYAAAEQDVINGQVTTCPADCGAPLDPAVLAPQEPEEATPAPEDESDG
jgi:basic membrane lipoprotein Med (substrate-binding protein (PBP1-ABC) superfamily)